jgi:hypothetical protein
LSRYWISDFWRIFNKKKLEIIVILIQSNEKVTFIYSESSLSLFHSIDLKFYISTKTCALRVFNSNRWILIVFFWNITNFQSIYNLFLIILSSENQNEMKCTNKLQLLVMVTRKTTEGNLIFSMSITWPRAMGMWATLCTKKRATRKAPGCQDRSRQVNKGYIGNAPYGRFKAHFWILKRHGFAHLFKCLRVSSDPLDTGSNPKIHLPFPTKKNYLINSPRTIHRGTIPREKIKFLLDEFLILLDYC